MNKQKKNLSTHFKGIYLTLYEKRTPLFFFYKGKLENVENELTDRLSSSILLR